MSVYLVKGKGWRFDFTFKGIRQTGAWYPSKSKARVAEALARENRERQQKRLADNSDNDEHDDMAFSELVKLRLDFVKAYRSEKHYLANTYHARRWEKRWGTRTCSSLNIRDIQLYITERGNHFRHSANQDLRCLRAMFNWGCKQGLIRVNPTTNVEFFPIDKKIRYVPPPEDIAKVLAAADPDDFAYLMTIRDTMARMGEVNRLTWDDIDLDNRTIVLYTRKKKGGHLTPRVVPMTARLHAILAERFLARDRKKPWVFWHRYYSRKQSDWVEGPYQDRKRIMKSLCKKAGVRYFRFHALRHAGASVLDSLNVPIGTIQNLLGHQNRTTTEIYLHSLGNSEQEAVKLLEAATAHQNPHTQSHTEKVRRLRLVT